MPRDMAARCPRGHGPSCPPQAPSLSTALRLVQPYLRTGLRISRTPPSQVLPGSTPVPDSVAELSIGQRPAIYAIGQYRRRVVGIVTEVLGHGFGTHVTPFSKRPLSWYKYTQISVPRSRFTPSCTVPLDRDIGTCSHHPISTYGLRHALRLGA
eukprot:987531-Rhodomonas_salina.1